MKATLFRDKLQMGIFCGLVFSGFSLALGLFTRHTAWLGVASYFGPFLGASAIVTYLVKLSSAFIRNTVGQFWSDLSLINMGLTVIGMLLISAETPEAFARLVPWATVIGIGFSWILAKSAAMQSRLGLLLVHLLIPLLIYVAAAIGDATDWPKSSEVIFAIAMMLVVVPIMRTVATNCGATS